MKNNQTLGVILVIAGLISLIAAPASTSLLTALGLIILFAGIYIALRSYILADKKHKEKDNETPTE